MGRNEMTTETRELPPYKAIIAALAVFIGLYAASLYSYLLFHSLAEIFSVIVACCTFFIAWNSRRFLTNNYLIFIGIAYLFVAAIDLVHALSYAGMGVFPGYDPNVATQLWISARYLQAISLVVAPLLLTRELNPDKLFIIFSAIFVMVIASIFVWNIFPVCYVDGIGLTPFKITSEFLICLISLASMGMLLRYRDHFDQGVLKLLIWSIIFTVGSELAFTLYESVYGTANLIGHYFKIISFYFIYKAVIETGLREPYDLLFRELKTAHDVLEGRVRERTAELQSTNQELRLSEERFRAVFESASDNIFIKDLFLRYTHVNPSMEKLLGLPSSEIIGRTAEELFDAEVSAYIRDAEKRVLQGEVVEAEHTQNIRGISVSFNEIRVPLRNSSGDIVALCGISRDITDRRIRESMPSTAPETYSSKAMRETLNQAKLAAATESVALLLGESGSGKDYLARYIHEHSKRSGGPFFSINCAAVPPDLAESELFGHERGAFTGAHGRKRGLMELAEGGTLLLNEIGELPLPLQAKLLTFLDDRHFTRVGGEKKISINARIIAATNRDLEKEVAEARFRQDLFYRINIMNLAVPPLRERVEDIPVLADEILSILAKDLELNHIPTINQSTMDSLIKYHWPGNVRELRNVLERGLMLWDGVSPDLPLPSLIPGQTEWSRQVTFPSPGHSLRDITDEITKALCVEALQRCKGNKKDAAQLLGIARDSLYRYLKEFGIESEIRAGSQPLLDIKTGKVIQ